MKTRTAVIRESLASLIAIVLFAGAAFGHQLPGLPSIPGTPYHAPPQPGVNAPLVPLAERPAETPELQKAVIKPILPAPLPNSILPTYSAMFLNGVSGFQSFIASSQAYLTAVDSEGDVVGYVVDPSFVDVSFVYVPSANGIFGLLVGLGQVGVPTGIGYSIQKSGGTTTRTLIAVGYFPIADAESVYGEPPQAFASQIGFQNGSFAFSSGHTIGTLPGGTFSAAMGIDDTGTYIVGYSDTASGQIHGFINSGATFGQNFSSGAMADLGTFNGGNNSVAYGVQGGNGAFAGDPTQQLIFVAGAGDFGSLDTSGFPILNSFDTFAPSPLNVSQSSGGSLSSLLTAQLTGAANVAYAVDTAGDIAGEQATGATDSSGNPIYNAYIGKPAIGEVSGGIGFAVNATGLGALATGANSYAYGVNPNGFVVGESEITPGGPIHGFLADPSGAMHDLNTLVPAVQRTLPGATSPVAIDYIGGINASGTIVGSAQGNPIILTQTAPGEFNITSEVTITPSPPIWNKADKTWVQNVTVSNLPGTGSQTFDLLLNSLSPTTVSLTDKSGSLLSRPYVTSSAVSNGAVTFTLVFSGPKTANITYTPYVYQVD